ncbi:hypothetical protein [Streptococcus dentiloxodontae]
MSLLSWFKKSQALQNFEPDLSLMSHKVDILNPNLKEVEEAVLLDGRSSRSFLMIMLKLLRLS